jgi:hypothetical protein
MKKSIPGVTKAPSKKETKPSSKNPSLIRLTKIKQWWLPADAESYSILKDAGVPLIRFHVDFLPTLKLLTDKHHIRAKEVHFKSEIMDPFMDLMGSTWNKKPHCRATIGSRTMKFETLKPEAFAKAKESLPKLEALLAGFFTRWGFNHRFEYSESRGKCRLNVEYFFDSTKLPVIPLHTEPGTLPKIQLKLGFARLTFTFDNYDSKTVTLPPRRGQQEGVAEHKIGYVHLTVEVSQGGVFKPIYSNKCLYSQLSSVKPLIAALMTVPDHDIHNFDNSANQ